MGSARCGSPERRATIAGRPTRSRRCGATASAGRRPGGDAMPVSHTVEVRTRTIDHEVHAALLERFAATLFADMAIAGPAIGFDATMKAIEVRARADAGGRDEAAGAVVGAMSRAVRHA